MADFVSSEEEQAQTGQSQTKYILLTFSEATINFVWYRATLSIVPLKLSV